MGKFIISGYEDEMMVLADICEVVGENLVLHLDGEITGVWHDWAYCFKVQEEEGKKLMRIK